MARKKKKATSANKVNARNFYKKISKMGLRSMQKGK